MGKAEWVEQYPNPADRVAHLHEILEGMNALFVQKTTAEWLVIFEAADVPCGPVYTFDETLRDPQLAVNQTFVEYDHPVAGRVRGVNVPGKFSATPPTVPHAAPGLGEHTVEILREFGLSQGQITALLQSKAATQSQQPQAPDVKQAATA
jgi:crotonobetainyl-CoA:carnitine CoA-transferase CaiB-like acyl-CoA transferase